MSDLREMREGARSRMDELAFSARRAGPGPVLVRAGMVGAGLLAQAVAWPLSVVSGWALLVILVLAVLPVLAPRSRVVTVVILFTVAGWLVSTTAYLEPVSYWRLILLAGLLYLLHTLAALAAVLPYDAVISPGVLGNWLRRAGVVMLLTVAVSLFTLLVPQYLGGRRYLAASLVGLALLVGLAGYLAALIRRR